MDCPKFGGSNYYNYKGFHSVVLMAICDSKYRFIYADMGSYGRDNDASILSRTELYEMFESGTMNIPPPAPIMGVDTPYFLVGDEIFALKHWLLKPYASSGGRCTEDSSIFNYRLSRARRTIENAFGIMAARWRVFRKPIRANVTTVDSIVRACVCLHNYLLTTETARYTPQGFVDSFDSDGVIDGDWRKLVSDDTNPALRPPGRIATNNYSQDAKLIRDHMRTYVLTEGKDRCHWQTDKVRCCGLRMEATSS